jgi:hypothetical protein
MRESDPRPVSESILPSPGISQRIYIATLFIHLQTFSLAKAGAGFYFLVKPEMHERFLP